MTCSSCPAPEPGELSPLGGLIPLAEIPRHLPPVNGRRPNISTVWRWVLKGVSGTKLEAVRYGRCWFVSPAALEKFGREMAARSIEKLDRPAPTVAPKPRTRSEARRAKDIEAAKEILRAEGCLK